MIPAPAPKNLDRVLALVLDSVNSPESKRAYQRGIHAYQRWHLESGKGAFNKSSVQAFKTHLKDAGLSHSAINTQLIAVRRLAAEAADNGMLDPTLAAAIGRVKGLKVQGVRSGNWLTREQAERLLNAPDSGTLKGLRDRALLAVLVGCGLRRQEAATLTLDSIQQRDGRWVIVDMHGKGGRVRTVPVPAWAKAAIDGWTQAAGFQDGRVFRPVNKGGRISGQGMTAQSVYEVVKAYAGDIAPHDLRRTFAKLAHKGHAAIDQIQLSLGHASIMTTERYLGTKQELACAPCDVLGLRLAG